MATKGDATAAAKKPAKAPAKKPAAKTTAAKAAAPAAKAATPAKKPAAKAPAAKKREPSAAFMKALTPSAELAAIVGATPLPRTEVVRKLWAYIKEFNLQDASNKRVIKADAKLKAVFGKSEADMFEMTRLVSNHLK